MTYLKCVFLIVLPMICMYVQAQSDVTVEHTYVYHAAHNESPEQAERIAINYARNEALRKKFGTTVSGASASSLITKNNITKSKFVSLSGEGEANGEWIADLEEPKVTPKLENGSFCVTATVKGKAREITNNPINYEAKILRNEPKISLESTEFTAGDMIYIHFKSPVDGYLTIYLLDGETAYCLLPYANDDDGRYSIIHGKEYILFSRKTYDENENPNIIDEYKLTTDGNHQDLNQFLFIFSPKEFTKANDTFRKTDDGTMYPRMLSWENFQDWILHIRRKDKEMSVQTKYITINPMKD